MQLNEQFVIYLFLSIVAKTESSKMMLVNETTAGQKVPRLDSPMPRFASSSSFPDSAKPVITVLASINYGGTYIPTGPICSKVMELALDRLKMQQNWLPDYELAFELSDNQCDDAAAIRQLVQNLELAKDDSSLNRIPVMIVPQCTEFSQLIMAEVVKHYSYVGLTVTQNSPQLYVDRHRYSSFFGLGQRADFLYIVIVDFILAMGWRKIAIFSEIYPYFDESEKYLIPYLELKNITLLWMGKVISMSQSDDEMAAMVQEMKSRDPRIILQNTDSPVSMSCWLHRFAMYGPNYVILSSDWSYFNPATVAIPDYISKWCTRAMLAEVFPSWIFFGGGLVGDVFGPNYVDSTGLSVNDFSKALTEKVIDADKSPAWFTWPRLCYDQALFAGSLVNATVQILKQKNVDILNWTVSSKNFKQHGEAMIKLVKEAVYQTGVDGFRGHYRFDPKTTLNTLGYTPMTVTKGRKIDSVMSSQAVFERYMIGYYKSNEDPAHRLIMFTGERKVKWGTLDGLPPRDSVQVIASEVEPTSRTSYATFAAIGTVGIMILSSLMLFPVVKMRLPGSLANSNFMPYSNLELCGLLGNVIMVAHVFAIPFLKGSGNHLNCSAESFLIVAGFSASLITMLLQLTRGLAEVRAKVYINSHYHQQQFFLARLLRMIGDTLTRKHAVIFSTCFVAVQVILFGVLVSINSITAVVTKLPPVASRFDPSIIYQPFRYECHFGSEKLDDQLFLGVLVTMALLQVFVILRLCFTAYAIRTIKGRFVSGDLKFGCTSVYCEILLLVTCGFGVALELGDGQNLQIVVSSTVIAFATINTVMLTLGKVTNNDSPSPRGTLANRTDQHVSVSTALTVLKKFQVGRSRSIAPQNFLKF